MQAIIYTDSNNKVFLEQRCSSPCDQLSQMANITEILLKASAKGKEARVLKVFNDDKNNVFLITYGSENKRDEELEGYLWSLLNVVYDHGGFCVDFIKLQKDEKYKEVIEI